MSANGLSAGGNVRNSFTIPGEGWYELRSELVPSTVAAPAGSSGGSRNTTGTSQTSSSSGGNYGGPLGLANATMLTVTSEMSALSDTSGAGSGSKGGGVGSVPNTPERSTRTKAPLVKKFGLGGLHRFGSQGPTDGGSSGGGQHRSGKNTSGTDISVPEIEKLSVRECELYYVLVYNNGDVLYTSSSKEEEAVQTLKFRSTITAMEASNGLRLLVGCANGEVYYYSDVGLLSAKGSHSGPTSASALMGNSSVSSLYNKDGHLDSSRVTALQWIPGSLTKFVAVHLDGGLFMYDTRARFAAGTSKSGRLDGMEDNWKSSPNPSAPSTAAAGGGQGGNSQSNVNTGGAGASPNSNSSPSMSSTGNGSGTAPSSVAAGSAKTNGVLSSNNSSANHSGSTPGTNSSSAITEALSRGSSTKRIAAPMPQLGQHQIASWHPPRGRKSNPMLQMQVGKGGLNDAAFGPEGTPASSLIALACRDGYLRVIDFDKEVVLYCLRSYYGALLCVSWSHDGKYIATGGEDDLVTVWSAGEGNIVARLEGHSSWVSSVAWDETAYSNGRYRIGSGGQDAKLALWDFCVDSLHLRVTHRQSKTKTGPTTKAAPTNSGKLLGGKFTRGLLGSAGAVPSGSSAESNESSSPLQYIQKEALVRAQVPILEPLVDHVAHNEPITSLAFTSDAIVTACTGGVVRVWWKPPAVASNPLPHSGSLRSTTSPDADQNGPSSIELD